MSEELIKNKDRVKNYGEVFTPLKIVNEMLDLVEPITIEKTFLEPTCGNGNFVVEIYRRKFKLCKNKKDFETALKSVVAIDLLPDNIEECKNRVKDLLKEFGRKEKFDFILNNHIFAGNSLAIMRLFEERNEPMRVIYPRTGEAK